MDIELLYRKVISLNMRGWFIFLGLVAASIAIPARAVEDDGTSPASYQETAPTNTNIPNWLSGWTQPSVQPTGTTYTTGWNYVGTDDEASAVYLGYGWFLTAG